MPSGVGAPPAWRPKGGATKWIIPRFAKSVRRFIQRLQSFSTEPQTTKSGSRLNVSGATTSSEQLVMDCLLSRFLSDFSARTHSATLSASAKLALSAVKLKGLPSFTRTPRTRTSCNLIAGAVAKSSGTHTGNKEPFISGNTTKITTSAVASTCESTKERTVKFSKPKIAKDNPKKPSADDSGPKRIRISTALASRLQKLDAGRCSARQKASMPQKTYAISSRNKVDDAGGVARGPKKTITWITLYRCLGVVRIGQRIFVSLAHLAIGVRAIRPRKNLRGGFSSAPWWDLAVVRA